MAISSETVREFENKFGSFNISDFEYFTQTANDFEVCHLINTDPLL